MNKSRIYATVLLSDEEILFWRIGQHEKNKYDFYKDFYYADMNQEKYFENHDMRCESICFEFEDDDECDRSNFVFNVLAREFFKIWPISKDTIGDKPYEEVSE